MKKMILKIEDLEERIAPSVLLDVSLASANSWHGNAGSHELPEAAGAAASANSGHGNAGSHELPEAAVAAIGKGPVVISGT